MTKTDLEKLIELIKSIPNSLDQEITFTNEKWYEILDLIEMLKNDKSENFSTIEVLEEIRKRIAHLCNLWAINRNLPTSDRTKLSESRINMYLIDRKELEKLKIELNLI